MLAGARYTMPRSWPALALALAFTRLVAPAFRFDILEETTVSSRQSTSASNLRAPSTLATPTTPHTAPMP